MRRPLFLAAVASLLLAGACSDDPEVEPAPVDGIWQLSRTVHNPTDARCSAMTLKPVTLQIASDDAVPVRVIGTDAVPEVIDLTETSIVFETDEDAWRSGILQSIYHDLELDGDQLIGSNTLHADSADHSCEWTIETVGVREEIPCLRSAGNDCAF